MSWGIWENHGVSVSHQYIFSFPLIKISPCYRATMPFILRHNDILGLGHPTWRHVLRNVQNTASVMFRFMFDMSRLDVQAPEHVRTILELTMDGMFTIMFEVCSHSCMKHVPNMLPVMFCAMFWASCGQGFSLWFVNR